MLTKNEAMEMERRINERIDNIEKQTSNNSKAIGELTTNMNHLTVSTQGIVDVWSAGRTLQKAVKWLSGFSVIAAVVAWWYGKF